MYPESKTGATLAPFNPSMVTLARELRGITQKELADASEVAQGSQSKLEAGDIPVTPGVVAKIAQRVSLPESFFFQTGAVYPFGSSTFYHRRQQSLLASVLRKIQARINVYRLHVTKFIEATDLDYRCKFKHFDLKEHSGRVREVANLVRATWRLAPGPIPDMTRAIEDAGGIVIRFDFGTIRLFGISEWIPPAPPLFFLNNNPEISADRDRFTLAHELGHLLLHELPTTTMEAEADLFAGEFLMPEKDIRPHLHPPLKLLRLVELKKHWKVSMQALIENAFRLEVINERQRQYLWIQLSNRGYRLREPVELTREQPTLLRDIIRAHIRELGYTTPDLARMLHLHPGEFREWYPNEESKLTLIKS
jgi:Zn-dependent peptidase ImmA (M78 family)/transcriptional regulator with XRE-family HTH domain